MRILTKLLWSYFFREMYNIHRIKFRQINRRQLVTLFNCWTLEKIKYSLFYLETKEFHEKLQNEISSVVKFTLSRSTWRDAQIW